MTEANSQVDSAVKNGDTHLATISRIDTSDEDAIENFVTVNGHEFSLSDAPPLWDWRQIADYFTRTTSYSVGQQVEVALDEDSELDWAYDISKYGKFSWQFALLGLLFMLGIAATARGLLTRSFLLTDRARLHLWRTKKTSTVTVLEVRHNSDPRVVRIIDKVIDWFSDHDHQRHYLVLESQGRVLYWEAKSDGETLIEPGMTFEVFGRLKHRGWIVAMTEPALYPAIRLD